MKSSKKTGVVYLVGAGPGDPGLMTLRGKSLLELADVVVYDYLANPKLLGYCPRAEHVYVGKKSSSHTMTQEKINALLVTLGKSGKRIVRLKAGDPFVFGRGGEECEALAKARVRFEIVPGITAAVAAPAYAGIPVTHRDLNSSFTLITGHESKTENSDLDWSALAKLPCLAFYMGVAALKNIGKQLIENGMSKEMPAATIQWGSTPRQRTVVSTIGKLHHDVSKSGVSSPAITIIGRVVKLRKTINWFENRPLFGKSIIVTRTRQQASDLSRKLEELGAEVIEAPTVEVKPPRNYALIDAALKRAGEYDWIIFTSANGVTAARDRMRLLGLDVRTFGDAKIAAIGPATAKAIQDQLCLNVDLCPKQFVAEALGKELISKNAVKNGHFLMLRADIARPVLSEQLRSAGAMVVSDVPIYTLESAKQLPAGLVERLDAGEIDWITFASSSSVMNMNALAGIKRLKKLKIAAIGPITAGTLKELKLKPTVVAREFTIDGLLKSILEKV